MLCLGSFWLIRGPPFREGEYASLHPSIYRILIVYCVAVSEQYVVELSGLLYFRGNFVQPYSFPIFNFSENRVEFLCVNGPSLMSNCLLIILVIGSCIIFGRFPSKFSKCCFHSFILSCWFAALSFALAVFFLLLTSFIVCQAILDCLSSTESLILSIWFWMYSVCSFIYMPANWYCAVFSFKAFVFVGFFDCFWRLFSLVHVFLSPLKFPMGLYI